MMSLYPDPERVVAQAIQVLERVGVLVEHVEGAELLQAAGCERVSGRLRVSERRVREALATAPSLVRVHGRDPDHVVVLGHGKTHFDPGSAALNLLDVGHWRPATAQDCAHLGWVTQGCSHLALQATALVPCDVPEPLQDRYRLRAALEHCAKPVVTGTFRAEAFGMMRDLLELVRGGSAELRAAPLAIFDCCPTSPLQWSTLTCQALLDCARAGIPANLISVPLGGATAPVTLREMVVQHAAESLFGVVLHQLAAPGAPLIWGGAPAAFDMRQGTTPMGAVEAGMVNLANAAVGRSLGLPTHGYLAVSDSKCVDWQAGAETARGATLAVLGGIDLVAGPGMLGFLGCQSLEKLVLDDQLCGAALRLQRGFSEGSAEDAVELIADGVHRGQVLGSRHTRRNFRRELFLPSTLIDRGSIESWLREGERDAMARAAERVQEVLAAGNPVPLDPALIVALDQRYDAEVAAVVG